MIFRGGRFNYLFSCGRLSTGHLLSIIVIGSISGYTWETSGCKWILEAVYLITSLVVADSVHLFSSVLYHRRRFDSRFHLRNSRMWVDFRGGRVNYLFSCGRLSMGHLLSIIVAGSIPGSTWEISGCEWIFRVGRFNYLFCSGTLYGSSCLLVIVASSNLRLTWERWKWEWNWKRRS